MSRLLFTCSLCLSALALVGWANGELRLASLLASGRAKAMAPMSAIVFCLSSLAGFRRPGEPASRRRPALLFVACLSFAAFLVASHDFLGLAPDMQDSLIPEGRKAILQGPNDGHSSTLTTLAFLTQGCAAFALFLSGGRRLAGKSGAGPVLASASSLLSLFIALCGLSVLVGYLYSVPLLSGAISLPSGIVLFLLGMSWAISPGDEAWPVRLFLGSSVEARLLRLLIPLLFALAVGEGAAMLAAARMSDASPLVAVLSFALLVFGANWLTYRASRRVSGSIDRLIAERTEAEARLSEALRIKDGLLGEINHRTRNSLQLVLSFIDLEGASPGPGSWASLGRRTAILAYVHDCLSRGPDPSAVRARDFLSGLAGLLSREKGMDYRVSAGDFALLFDLAAPLGILIGEFDSLARTSRRQAPGGGAGGALAVELSFREEGRGYLLSYLAGQPLAFLDGDLEFAAFLARHQLAGEVLSSDSEKGTELSVHMGECAYARRI
jgi:two-component sensor histidine kinase